MKIGVLALQGAFAEHEKVLEQLGAECIELRQARDLAEPYDALVLPGGESTVQGKLLSRRTCTRYQKRYWRLQNEIHHPANHHNGL